MTLSEVIKRNEGKFEKIWDEEDIHWKADWKNMVYLCFRSSQESIVAWMRERIERAKIKEVDEEFSFGEGHNQALSDLQEELSRNQS